jgi:serine/threonine-protein kinase
MNPACSVSGVLEDIIFRCIAKNPAERFSSMDDVLAALKKSGAGALTGTMMASSTGQFSAVSGHISEPSSPLVSRGASQSGPQSSPSTLSGQSQSGPLPSLGTALPTDGSSLPPEKKSNKNIFLAAGGLALLVAVGGIAFTRGQADSNNSTPAAQPSAAATTAPVEPPSAPPTASAPATASAQPPAAEKFSIRIESEPSGATVRLREKDGDEVCRETPCEVALKGSDITKGKEIKAYVSKRGYQTESKTFKVGDEKISLKLAAAGGGGAPVPRPPPPGGGDNGFKPVPY